MNTAFEAHPEYFALVGEISVIWAKLHDDLSYFYCGLFGEMRSAAEAAWFSHRNDSSQRDLLRKTVEALPAKHKLQPACRDDVIWSINKIDDAAKTRNAAIHTAVMSTYGSELRTIVNPWSRDPRSIKLQGTEMSTLLKECLSTIRPILEFNRLMFSSLSSSDRSLPWPRRPVLQK